MNIGPSIEISTDGSLDTEPVQPFSATRAVTLPAGSGTKTVLVQYFNRAGMPSFEVSDTISLSSGADLRVSALANPPTSKARGASFTATDTTTNRGTVTAAATSTRYYLSLNTTKGAGDVLLTGIRAVPQLAADLASSGSRAVTIPIGAPAGNYFLLACAGDQKLVSESNETNNCRASTTTIRVT